MIDYGTRRGIFRRAEPAAADADSDGLSDITEAEIGTNPTDPDSDDDGLTDATEVKAGMNPLNHDTDSDGTPDGAESRLGIEQPGPPPDEEPADAPLSGTQEIIRIFPSNPQGQALSPDELAATIDTLDISSTCTEGVTSSCPQAQTNVNTVENYKAIIKDDPKRIQKIQR